MYVRNGAVNPAKSINIHPAHSRKHDGTKPRTNSKAKNDRQSDMETAVTKQLRLSHAGSACDERGEWVSFPSRARSEQPSLL